MSVVLDALRRKSAAASEAAASASGERGATVLGSLGMSRHSQRRWRTRRLVTYGAISVVGGFVAVAGVVLFLTRPIPEEPGAAPTSTLAGSPAPPVPPAAAPPPEVLPGASSAPLEGAAAGTPGSAREAGAIAAQPPRQANATRAGSGNAGRTASTRTPEATQAPPLPVPGGAGGEASVAVLALVPAAGDRFSLAVYYQRARDYDRALGEYQAILRENDERADVHNNIGLIYQQKGDDAQATSHFRRAIALAPRYVKAHNNLGVTFLRAGSSDAAAAEFLLALSVEPRNVESLVNLALASRAQGRPADARNLLRQALAIDPRNAGAHYNLGLVAEEGGDANLAITHYQSFLRFGALTDVDLVPKVRTRLAELGGG